jgi:DNA-binding Lrp family transcriptional regulator
MTGLDISERWKGIDPRRLPLDRTDMAILSILLRNSRESCNRIARQAGVTESTVRRRMRSLVSKGLIQSFTTKINLPAVEGSLKAFVHLSVTPGRLQEVVARMLRHPRVTGIHRVTGPHNLLLSAVFVSTAELQDFTDNFLRIDGITGSEIQIVMGTHKQDDWGGI